VEKCRKPLPEFFQILFERYNVKPREAVFIDDNIHNIHGAKALGMNTIVFQSPEQLHRDLRQWNINPV
jgi:2-haloacid dehalogenase